MAQGLASVHGAEMEIFQHAAKKLAQTLVVQAEVNFFPLYIGQPQFGDVDVFLHRMGFQFHRMGEIISRAIQPILVNGDMYAPLSQMLEADVVYVRDVTQFEKLTPEKLLKLAVILHDVYRSVDLAYCALVAYDEAVGTEISVGYLRELMGPKA